MDPDLEFPDGRAREGDGKIDSDLMAHWIYRAELGNDGDLDARGSYTLRPSAEPNVVFVLAQERGQRSAASSYPLASERIRKRIRAAALEGLGNANTPRSTSMEPLLAGGNTCPSKRAHSSSGWQRTFPGYDV